MLDKPSHFANRINIKKPHHQIDLISIKLAHPERLSLTSKYEILCVEIAAKTGS